MPTDPPQSLPEAERRRRRRDWGLAAGGALMLLAAFWVASRVLAFVSSDSRVWQTTVIFGLFLLIIWIGSVLSIRKT